MRTILLTIVFAAAAAAADPPGDPAVEMVAGIKRYLLRATEESVATRAPSRERLRKILGVVDARTPFTAIDLVADSAHPALLAENSAYQVYTVRWPVLEGMTAEGLWFKPRGRVAARVVSIPDAGQLPERFQEIGRA